MMPVSLGAMIALLSLSIPIRAAQSPAGSVQTTAAEGGITEDQILASLTARNQMRAGALLEYAADRTYRVSGRNGKVHAEIDGRMEFHAPDTKRFVVTSERGSAVVRRLALQPLIAAEIRTAA